MTDWKPDTCGCVLRVEEDWSKAVSLVKCKHHADHADDEHFNIVLKENQTKNQVLSYIKENHLDALIENQKDIANKDENGWAEAYGVIGSVTFDSERKLAIQLPTLAEKDKLALQAVIDDRHGTGNATVV